LYILSFSSQSEKEAWITALKLFKVQTLPIETDVTHQSNEVKTGNHSSLSAKTTGDEDKKGGLFNNSGTRALPTRRVSYSDGRSLDISQFKEPVLSTENDDNSSITSDTSKSRQLLSFYFV
jgi:hypothetical protein